MSEDKKWHNGECIIATGKPGQDGYAKKKIEGKTYRAHRAAFCLARNIPFSDIAGQSVLHSCDNPMCINPEHLSLGSHQENMLDMRNKNRQAKGQKISKAKLTEQQVLEIKTTYVRYSRTRSCKVFANKFGVSVRAINAIIEGKNWSWL